MPNSFDILLFSAFVWVGVVVVFLTAKKAEGRFPADDVGLMFLTVFAFYATIPPLSWLYNEGRGLSLRIGFEPSSADAIYLLQIACAYAAGFLLTYVPMRKRAPRFDVGMVAHVPGPEMNAAILIIVMASAFAVVFKTGGLIRSADSYIDQYRAIQELPLVTRQILKVVSSLASVAQWVLLVAALQRWRRQRWLLIAYLALVALSFDPQGSRAAVATASVSTAVAWHTLVRPISFRGWLMMGGSGLVAFLILGWQRASAGSGSTGGVAAMIGQTEFDEVWANAVELLDASTRGLELPFSARWGEFWAFLPSQVLPFEKAAADVWYVETFYPIYALQGGGFAFGAIAQAVVGGGIIEALLRGAALGALAVFCVKWYRQREGGWWRLPTYIYIYAFSYQLARDTTFSLMTDLIQKIVPSMLVIALLGTLISPGRERSRGARNAVNPTSHPYAPRGRG